MNILQQILDFGDDALQFGQHILLRVSFSDDEEDGIMSSHCAQYRLETATVYVASDTLGIASSGLEYRDIGREGYRHHPTAHLHAIGDFRVGM